MSPEKDVDATQKDGGTEEAVPEVKPDASGKYPETVPYKDYVGVKESLGRKLDKATAKVTELEEQLKNAGSPEEVTKMREELNLTKTQLSTLQKAETERAEQALQARRDALKQFVPEEKLKVMDASAIEVLEAALIAAKPRPDNGDGMVSSDRATAKSKISAGFEALHPKGI